MPRVYPRACGGTILDMGGELYLRLYPRACGGTPESTRTRALASGLSPRVRGNPSPRHGYGRALPPALSPRVRGNRPGERALYDVLRSIPARAGEPVRPWLRWLRSGVYPRACGGTCVSTVGAREIDGLSPRVRGNPYNTLPCLLREGSIPARAGEPVSGPRGVPSTGTRVYPRACGGTSYPERRSVNQ